MGWIGAKGCCTVGLPCPGSSCTCSTDSAEFGTVPTKIAAIHAKRVTIMLRDTFLAIFPRQSSTINGTLFARIAAILVSAIFH
jgi:hypothetical protein